MTPKVPFDSLPLHKSGPRGNAWFLFGKDDQCGMLNLLTPETTANAAREIIDGTRVSTDWPLDAMSRPCFDRLPLEHTIKPRIPDTINDDSLNFNTQSSSQWDGFRHFGYQEEKVFFNNHTQDDVMNTSVIGTQAWVERGGIVGRGVLLDWAAWADARGINLNPLETHSITVSTLKEIAAIQGSAFKDGDILFVRTGWVRGYLNLSDEECLALANEESPPATGVETSEETLRWLWDQSFAAVVGDNPNFEAFPCQDKYYSLHEWLLAGWGMPIGEIFDLEELSRICQEKNRWSFFFSSMPLKVPGGVASPPNGVAIF